MGEPKLESFITKRQEMVYQIREKYGLISPGVLAVLLQIPREEFVSEENKDIAYHDDPVSIGYGQTMSQPYTVAFMTDLVISDKRYAIRKKKLGKILEIGTGSGYQAAVLSKLFKEVYTIEIVPELARRARTVLECQGYTNIHVKTGSGEWGWKEYAPFDAIIITAGVERVPEELFNQLKAKGVLVVPIGRGYDKVMTRYSKQKNLSTKKLKKEEFGVFHFVPFVEDKS